MKNVYKKNPCNPFSAESAAAAGWSGPALSAELGFEAGPRNQLFPEKYS